jgi:hypothetical protein
MLKYVRAIRDFRNLLKNNRIMQRIVRVFS